MLQAQYHTTIRIWFWIELYPIQLYQASRLQGPDCRVSRGTFPCLGLGEWECYPLRRGFFEGTMVGGTPTPPDAGNFLKLFVLSFRLHRPAYQVTFSIHNTGCVYGGEVCEPHPSSLYHLTRSIYPRFLNSISTSRRHLANPHLCFVGSRTSSCNPVKSKQ